MNCENYSTNIFSVIITNNATGLMWQQADDGIARDWKNALSYAENLNLAKYSNWHLPNAKELQSLIDYMRCPSYNNSPAIKRSI